MPEQREIMKLTIIWQESLQKISNISPGADSAILDRLARTTDESAQLRILRTHHHLHTYSKLGLRVLCMAKRVLSPREYEEWAGRHKEAENALSNREHLLQDSYCKIEKELKLLGR